MPRSHAEIFADLSKAVVDMDSGRTRILADEALQVGIDPYEAISEGLTAGMNRVNELFEQEEYFVPEILLSADAMNAGIEVLRPHMLRASTEEPAKVVIGVMKGDTHDIGKNIVRMMMENAGYQVKDLGRDVPYAEFVTAAGDMKADLVCLSTLMTSTMDGMRTVIEQLRRGGLAARVLVGGGPISEGYAKRIGAHGYGKTAVDAVKIAKKVLAGRAQTA